MSMDDQRNGFRVVTLVTRSQQIFICSTNIKQSSLLVSQSDVVAVRLSGPRYGVSPLPASTSSDLKPTIAITPHIATVD